jgi:hypothetical protein
MAALVVSIGQQLDVVDAAVHDLQVVHASTRQQSDSDESESVCLWHDSLVRCAVTAQLAPVHRDK